jgi:hypothetical protein
MRTLALPIRTARLNLREFVRGDFAAIHAYSADPRVTRYLFFGPRDEDSTAEYLDGLLASQGEVPRTRFELAVEEIGSGRVIGACDLSLIERGVADLGYMLGAPAGCGILRPARGTRHFDGRHQQSRVDQGVGKDWNALGSRLSQASARQEPLVGLPPVRPAARGVGVLAQAPIAERAASAARPHPLTGRPFLSRPPPGCALAPA